MDSEHIQFPAGKRNRARLQSAKNLRHPSITQEFKSTLAQYLSQPTESTNLNKNWHHVRSSMLLSLSSIWSRSPVRPKGQWIFSRSLAFVDDWIAVSACNHFESTRKSTKRQLTASLKRDQEQWWVSKAQSMEKAYAAGDTRSLFQLIRSMASKITTVNEIITEKGGTEFLSKVCRPN